MKRLLEIQNLLSVKSNSIQLYLIILGILVLGIRFLSSIFIFDQSTKAVIHYLCVGVSSVLASTFFCIAAFSSTSSKRIISVGWLLLGLGYGCLFFLSIFGVIVGQELITSVPIYNLIFSLITSLLFLGIIFLPTIRYLPRENLLLFFDMAIVFVSSSTIFWIFFKDEIITVFTAARGDFLTIITYLLAYPIGDLMSIWAIIALMIFKRNQSNPLSLWMLTLSYCIFLSVDIIQLLTKLPRTGLLGTLMILGIWLNIIAGVKQLNFKRNEPSIETRKSNLAIGIYIAYGFLALLWMVILSQNFENLIYSIVMTIAFCLVLTYQLIVFEENRKLNNQLSKINQELESRIFERTKELLDTNEELVKSQATLSAIYNSVNDAIIVYDYTENRFLDVNDRMCQMFGYQKNESLDLTFDKLCSEHEKYSAINFNDQIESCKNQKHSLIEWCFKNKTGFMIWGEVNLRYTFISKKSCLILTIRDVTERKQLEEYLSQAHKLEIIGQLAGGVAHDFNNLLTPIIAYTDTMISMKDDSDPDRQNLEVVLDAANRASSLTRQLLAFSRKQFLEMRTLDLNDQIRNICSILTRLVRENIEIKLHLDNLIGFIDADATQLHQILMNLVINAQDAMPTGGNIIIETSSIVLDSEYTQFFPDVNPGEYVMCSVSDNGCGIDSETQKKIFEPFFTTKEKGKGTGLGLAMVYGNIKQHKGHISVESQLGKGTTFKIFFPLAKSKLPDENNFQITQVNKNFTGMQVLVVEDNHLTKDLICKILKKNSMEVFSASSPLEALKILEKIKSINLLITDMIMPVMTGEELYNKISITYPKIAVLYISGYTGDSFTSERFTQDTINFLPKPFTERQLLHKVALSLKSDQVTK